jgi:hypothetical protein
VGGGGGGGVCVCVYEGGGAKASQFKCRYTLQSIPITVLIGNLHDYLNLDTRTYRKWKQELKKIYSA